MFWILENPMGSSGRKSSVTLQVSVKREEVIFTRKFLEHRA